MTTIPESLQHLTIIERLELAQALWESVPDQERPPISDARRAELLRRAAEDDARPDDVVPWDQVKAGITARLGRS